MGVARIFRTFAPYPHEVVPNIDYAQTADVVYTVHLDYPVYKATRTSHTSWTFSEVVFGPTVATPSTPTGSATIPNTVGYNAVTYRYKITAVGPTGQESRASNPHFAVDNDLTLAGNYNTIDLPNPRPAGVDAHVIYKEQGGVFGYIGSTDSVTFTDGNPQFQPLLTDTPPIGENPFSSAGSYPSTVTFHKQRLYLGGTRNNPNAVWGSQPVDFENMDTSRPNKPDDAVAFALVGEQVNSVNQLTSMTDLMVFTADGIFSVNGGAEGDAITPSSINPDKANSRGGSRLKPIPIDEVTFYKPTKGTSIRSIGFQFDIDGYQSNNITIFSPHFFKGFDIVSWAHVEEPYSAIFAVRSDGVLLCFTWEAEQQVWGWTLLETDGRVLTVASITEGGYDRLYAVIERVINGVTRRFHERLALPHVDDIALAVHLDCSITQVYDPAQNVVGGLWHLEGETVSAYYDGYVASDLVVTNGQITLPNDYEATVVTVGIPFAGEIETLPMVLESRQGSQHTYTQNIAQVVIRAVDTRGIEAGITGMQLEAIIEREGGEEGLPDVEQRDYPVTVGGHWKPSNTLTIQQNQPLPAHITGIFIEPKLGGK